MSEKVTNNKKRLEHWEVISLILMVYDFTAILVSYFAALWIRFDCKYENIQKDYLQTYFHTIWVYAVFCVVIFWFLRLYKSIWRFASYAELMRVIMGTVITGVLYLITVTAFK
ncbi:hypothetical protein [Blautia sp. MSJ-9]|uniref:hypothetical protein n=1 Tax=Blautia sp. MSJ-9 TaxID=2841511 RepID=UPI001C11C529|nr:hypothetical protein [Blautia sp. MSJ-9]MBU5680731.1 hypothetical protein [Blautia sp. MSJ-9]